MNQSTAVKSQPTLPSGVALVVGGSGGVGRAVAIAFASAGADVALTYRSNEAAGLEVVQEIESNGGKASAYPLDLSDLASTRALLDELTEARGALHTVVNAAGARIAQPYISQADPKTFQDVVHGDLSGFFNLVNASLPHLREGGGGSFVAITSAGLKRFPPGDILSVAPKAGIEALIRGIAREEGRYGVRANCVALGVIEAGMFLKLREAELDETWQAAAKANTPLRRFGTAQEVADATVFLASAGANYITGQTLMLDGGYTI